MPTGLIHVSAGGQIPENFGVFIRRYFPFLAEKYGLRPARPGLHVRTFDAVCTPETDETPTDSSSTDHNGGGGTAAAASSSAAAAVAATELRWCSLRLPAAPAALLLSRCVACACACGFGCGPRPLLHRCPLRTEKRKLPELTCELGLSPPGARTRAEPREKVHLMPAAGEENFAPRPESSAKMTGSRMAFASRG